MNSFWQIWPGSVIGVALPVVGLLYSVRVVVAVAVVVTGEVVLIVTMAVVVVVATAVTVMALGAPVARVTVIVVKNGVAGAPGADASGLPPSADVDPEQPAAVAKRNMAISMGRAVRRGDFMGL